MSGLCDGRIAIVTGAGRGIGREHALMLASEGAKVVVNDLGGEVDGTGGDVSPAQQVVEEIKGMGGEAIANGDDVSSWEGAQRMVNMAVETFGGLDAVINNAGILRDRMLTNMTEAEWDAVIQVHLKGTFAPSRGLPPIGVSERRPARPTTAASSTRARCPASTATRSDQLRRGQGRYRRLHDHRRQGAHRYGVTVNAIAPGALTRMTENLGMGSSTRRARSR